MLTNNFIPSEALLSEIASAKKALINIRKNLTRKQREEKPYDEFETWYASIQADKIREEFLEWWHFSDLPAIPEVK